MRSVSHFGPVVALACAATVGATDATAHRMIQNLSTGRTSFGTSVPCDAPLGFAHWTGASISWRLNPGGQGSKSGMVQAFQNAMAAWNSVSPAAYELRYGGTTGAGFASDGVNTVLWGTGNGCTGGCLAITALVLSAGQVITEADFVMNDAAAWSANGGDYDAQAIMTHELGHSLGIHHTELKQKRDRPTMYASYFGTDGRTLAADDIAALNCSFARYAPGAPASPLVAVEPILDGPGRPALRLRAVWRGIGPAHLRFALADAEPVRLDVFDVAGRRLATLLDEPRGAGEHEVAWDGSTASGRARPGVYFARVITPQGQATASLVLTQ